MSTESDRLPEASTRQPRARRDGRLPPSLDDRRRTVADVIAKVLKTTPGAADIGSEVLDSVGVAMYLTDAAGRITFFNEAAVDLWGRRPERGEMWCGSYRLFHPDGAVMAHADCPMAVALRERRPVRDEEAILERPDGLRVWFRPYPTPIIDDQGALTGAVNVLIDLTELRAAQEALRASADALRASAEALETSNAVKDEFLGLVSHELRTPITTVLGNAQLLRDRSTTLPEGTQASMVGDIAAEAERLLGIVENLLLLTRLDSGTYVDPEPQVMAHVIRLTVEAFRHNQPDRPITLQHEPRHLIVDADLPLLDLLLTNLLTNAHKYSPPSASIDVVVGSDDEEAVVRVLDRGIGLVDVAPGQLFTPFYRSAQARATTGGLGIGLAACRRVAEALGGRIWATAREGGGSEFAFALPLAKPLEPESRVVIA
jgi:PAS domain S-box-containing protein